MAIPVPVEHNWPETQWDWPLQNNDGVVKVHNTKEKFEVGLDAQYFTPKEIEVKVIGKLVEIHFEHSARKDSYGDITRTVNRTYALPDDVDPSTLKSSLNPRGVLIITASKKH